MRSSAKIPHRWGKYFLGVTFAREITEDSDEYKYWAGHSDRFPTGTGMFLSATASKQALQPIGYRESRDRTWTWLSQPLVSRLRLCEHTLHLSFQPSWGDT
jgi:hypothetical protein